MIWLRSGLKDTDSAAHFTRPTETQVVHSRVMFLQEGGGKVQDRKYNVSHSMVILSPNLMGYMNPENDDNRKYRSYRV